MAEGIFLNILADLLEDGSDKDSIVRAMRELAQMIINRDTLSPTKGDSNE